jgi:Ser/Thr protein kinase RdoA (MazF antagonist)
MIPMIADALKAITARYDPIARPLARVEPLGNAGGLSGARLWRYESGLGQLVARAWPPGGRTIADVRQIHAWLRLTQTLGFVAVPLADSRGRTVHELCGLIWDVSPWMPGTAHPGRNPPPMTLRAGLTGLATFHRILSVCSKSGPSPGLVQRLRELEEFLSGGDVNVEHALNRAPKSDLRESARQWLQLARWHAPRLLDPLRRALANTLRLQPCLRDARPDHFLFDHGQLTGLIDFGAMGVDAVACDLARLLAEWAGGDRDVRAAAIEAYHDVRPLDDTETALIRLFEETAALLGGHHWIRWHFLEGRVFDDRDAATRGINRGLERLAELVAATPGI